MARVIVKAEDGTEILSLYVGSSSLRPDIMIAVLGAVQEAARIDDSMFEPKTDEERAKRDAKNTKRREQYAART